MLEGPRFFNVFRTLARGLESQRIALSTATENLANARTSRAEGADPYAIKRAVHEPGDPDYNRFNRLLNRAQQELRLSDPRHASGPSLRTKLHERDIGPLTEVEEIVEERLEYDPSHPNANAEGYVAYPDINPVEEMARMISANRVYEANLTAFQAVKENIKRTMEI